MSRRCGTRADDGELTPVHRIEIEPARVREHEYDPARRERGERGRHAASRAQDRRVDGCVRQPGCTLRNAVVNEHLVAAMPQQCREQLPDEAAADHEEASARNALRAAQHACERLGVGAERIADRIRQRDEGVAPSALGESTRPDRRLGEALARRLVPRAAAPALAAGQMVDEDDALAAVPRRDDLVSEHRAGRRTSDLLDVRTAEPARADVRELALAAGLRDLVEPRLPVVVEHDRAHYSSLPKKEHCYMYR